MLMDLPKVVIMKDTIQSHRLHEWSIQVLTLTISGLGRANSWVLLKSSKKQRCMYCGLCEYRRKLCSNASSVFSSAICQSDKCTIKTSSGSTEQWLECWPLD